MKIGSSLSLLPAAVILILIILNGCLLKQNLSYKTKNRELILQNDSLISVNIHLSKEIESRADTLLTQQLNKSSRKRKIR